MTQTRDARGRFTTSTDEPLFDDTAGPWRDHLLSLLAAPPVADRAVADILAEEAESCG